MEERVLAYEIRSSFGSASSRRFRKQGLVPAIVYGLKDKTEHVLVNLRDFNKKFSKFTKNTVLILNKDKENRCVFLKEVSENIIRNDIYHIDFYEVKEKESIIRELPIKTIGASVGVKEGGTLKMHTTSINIKALPLTLPEYIEIDLTPLKKGDSFKAKDLKLAEKVEIACDPDLLLVSVE